MHKSQNNAKYTTKTLDEMNKKLEYLCIKNEVSTNQPSFATSSNVSNCGVIPNEVPKGFPLRLRGRNMVQASIRDVESRAETVFPMEDEQDFSTNKIYCANCINCKLIPEIQEGKTRYVLRIRCAAGKWKKKLGEEKIYKYCTINRRYQDSCDSYDEMGDTKTFLRELKKDLPEKDELYIISEEADV